MNLKIIIKISNNKILTKFIKYSIGGGIAALIDLGILYLLTSILGIFYIISATISFSISFIVGFLFQKYITFQNYDKKFFKQGIKFLIFQIIGLGINLLLLRIGVDILKIYYLYVAIFNKFIIFLRNFSMNLLFNFK